MLVDLIAESEGGRRKHRTLLQALLKKMKGTMRIASAYVTDTELLSGIKKRDVRLLTYLSPMDIIAGASSLDSLAALIKAGVQCRYMSGGPRLHAKVYVFDNQSAVVTSANLTWRALDKNIEVGVQISGPAAQGLRNWFDKLWVDGATSELDLATVRKWRRDTREQRAEYLARWKKAEKQPMPSRSAHPTVRSPKAVRDLFKTASQFFVCNTNRKHSHGKDEKKMHDQGYAAAWQRFQHPTHMNKVRKSDAIFMFAKGVGIIGIGRAKGRRKILKSGSSDRINRRATPEWRVPVEWLVWNENRAYRYKGKNPTFLDISDDRKLQSNVRKHFLSHP